MTGKPKTQQYSISADNIVRALLDDSRFKFKENGKYLWGGPCPNCGENELFISKEKPWVLKCNRQNKCGWEEQTKELLPDLFTNFAEKYRATAQEPNKTADAYLAMGRGFDLSKIRGWYEQDAYQDRESGSFYSTVRFYLDENRGTYWQRLIDPKPGVKKARFHGKYKGLVWQPPGFELAKGDRCLIVEGIFHAIALYHKDIKAVAAMSSVNFPDKFIEQHKGKGIRWTLALDGDKAGRRYAKSHAQKMQALGEKNEVLILPDGQDWDDLYRSGQITEKFIDYCLYCGRLFMSETVNDKAYHYYVRHRRKRFILDFENALYSIKVTDLFDKMLVEEAMNKDDDKKDENPDAAINAILCSPRGQNLFLAYSDVDQISNVNPQFLYMEHDEILDEQRYVIKIGYANGNSDDIIALEGTNITAPDAFHKALLNRTRGGTFDGDARQLKILRDRWLNKQMLTVGSIPYVGYDRDTRAYVFQNHAFHQGREIPLNEHGYFQIGNRGIKTSLSAVGINTQGKFNPDWLENYAKAFGWQGLTLLAYWLGTLFVQQIRAEDKTWPFLEFTGEPGAGKSTELEFCWKLVGRDDYEGFDIMKASHAGRRRAFNQLSNLPIVLIESDRDNGEKDSKARQFNFDECKPFFNGRGTGTLGVAKRGNDIEEHLFQASLIISQNAEVEGSEALLQRIVHCHVDKKNHGPGTRELARWFERQTSDTVGGFLRAALQHEREILDIYRTNFKFIEDQYAKQLKIERIAKNHAQVAACGHALRVLFPDMTRERCDKLTAYLLERAQARELRLAADHPMVEQFWEVFHYLNEECDTAKDGWLNHSPNPGRIAVNLPQFQERCQARGQERFDFVSLKKLLPFSRRHKFIQANASVRSKHTNKSKKCWIFEA